MNRLGFTLIELMIVVVIIGILASIAIPRFNVVSHRAKEKEADVILKQVHTMQEVHRAATGTGTGDVSDLIEMGLKVPAAEEMQYYQELVVGANCAHMAKKEGAAYNNRRVTYATSTIEDGTC